MTEKDNRRKLKAGVAGLGIAGTQTVQRLARHPKVELVAAADVRPQALEAFQAQYGGRTFDSVEAMCQDPDVEAIWISTPNHTHCEHVITAAENGTHAVVQKPMAVSLDEAISMVEASEKYGTKLLAGHSTALRPPFRAMRRVVDWGELGRLCAINVWSYTDWMLRPRMPQEVDLARGGGLVYRQGPHQVDAIRLIGGGLIRSVRAMTGQWMPERPCPGYYTAYLEFEDGTPATITHNGYGYFLGSDLVPWGVDRPRTTVDERKWFRNGLRSGGTIDEGLAKESLRFGGQRDEATAGQFRERPADRDNTWVPADPGIFILSFERGEIRQSPTGLYRYDDEGVSDIPITIPGVAYNSEVDELYDAVVQDSPIYHDGRWGLATLEVCLAIMESANQRREIYLEHQMPTFDPAHGAPLAES
jgi:phthalate 4,5-cis-dihydrodiol dehydrogenase